MLLWQDFPLQWGYARGSASRPSRQARAAVDLLGHHPSIAMWCGHNEPIALDVDPDGGDPTALRRMRRRVVAGQQLPSWNKTILDRWVKRAFEKADGTRPVIAHSGVLPHLPAARRHRQPPLLRLVPRRRARPARASPPAVPRLVRFVSEFGAQAVPDDADFMRAASAGPTSTGSGLGARARAAEGRLRRARAAADHATFDEWRTARRSYQAGVVRHHDRDLRRLKYRPTGGFALFSFADGHPAVSWSRARPRARRQARATRRCADACRPVIVIADRPPATVAPGDALALDVHVVSTTFACRSTARGDGPRCRGPAAASALAVAGDVPADDCVRVGTVRSSCPDVPGRARARPRPGVRRRGGRQPLRELITRS